MKRLNGMPSLLMAVAAVLAAASLARAQAVSEAAKLSDDRQHELVMRFATTSVSNLRSHTDANGRPKRDDEYTRDRILANLVRALFVQDTARPNVAPEGPRVMLARIKRSSTLTPDRTVLDVMGELVDWSYGHFYTDFYTPEKKVEFAQKSDADQEALFRLHLMMYENERLHQRTMKALNDRDAELRRQLLEMYDNAIVLADGRHVLRSNEGGFMVISGDPDVKDVKLEDRLVPEAQGLYDCMRARGLKNGREARAVCAAGPSQGGGPAAQSVTFTVCDAGDTALYVARVIHVESILVGEAYVASGWYRIEPKACKVVYDSEKAMGNTVFLSYMYRDTSDVLRNITPPPGSPVGGRKGEPLKSVRERFCVRPGEAFNYKTESKTEAETCQMGFTLANFIDSFDPSGYTLGNQTVTVAVEAALHTHPALSVASQTGYLLNGRKVTLNSLGQWVYENGHLIAKELIATRTGRPNLQPAEQASYIASPVREPYKDIEQVFRSVKPCLDDSNVRHSDFLFGMTESGVVSASSASTAGSSRFEFSYYAVLANLDFANAQASARNECYVVNVTCKAKAQCVQMNDAANVFWNFWVNTKEQADRILDDLRAIAPHYPSGEAELVSAR